MRLIGVDEEKIYNDVEGIEHHLSWNAIDRIGDLVQFFESDEARVDTLRAIQKQNEQDNES
ncbi:Mn-dependent DtxR family transcriptional regulator [Metabacillus sp. SLBN-84]